MGVMTQTVYEVPERASKTDTGDQQIATNGESKQTAHKPKRHSWSLGHFTCLARY